MLGNVVQLRGSRVFAIAEAQQIISIIRHFTREYASKVEQLIQRIDLVLAHDGKRAEELEAEANELFNEWRDKVVKLGGITKGMWMVDLDNGTGYFCWRYPEAKIEYYHGYKDGFSGRKKLSEFTTVTH